MSGSQTAALAIIIGDQAIRMARMSDTSLTLTIEPELHARFPAEADAVHRPAEEVLRELAGSFVTYQTQAREHDPWFRAAVEEALREAEDPSVARIPNATVVHDGAKQRADLMRRTLAGLPASLD